MTNRLPDSVRQVAEVIGEAAALELVKRWPRQAVKGDTPFRPVIYVPAKLTPDHRLVSIIGWHLAVKLVKACGGDIIFLATCANIVRDDRNQAIADALDRNASPAAIAARFNMSERQVRRVIAKMRSDSLAMGTVGMRGQHRAHHPQPIAA